MADRRPALDVQAPPDPPELTALIDTLLDDFSPVEIEEDERLGHIRRVHFASARDRDGVAHAIERHFGSTGIMTAPLEVDDERWTQRNQDTLRAVRVGEIVVSPPWDVPSDQSSAHARHHPPIDGIRHRSSRVDPIVPRRPPSRLGSGPVGARPGHLVWSARDRGSQTRGVSRCHYRQRSGPLATASDNITLNNVSLAVVLHRCNIRDLNADDAEPASIVLANVTRTLLADQPATFLEAVTTGGTLILGGITSAEETPVRHAFAPEATLVSRASVDGWLAFTFHPAHAHQP